MESLVGRGYFAEGGVRVPAMVWWSGMIQKGQLVGDMIHITDLFTNLTRLGGTLDEVPTDRIIAAFLLMVVLFARSHDGREGRNKV